MTTVTVKEDGTNKNLLMRVAFVVLLLSLTSSAQPKGFEFRGMRPGMTREAFAAAIANIAKDQGSKGTLECIPAAQHTLCMWGLYGAMLSNNQVFEITYKIPLFERPISGFVRAFTQKYGKPTAQRRSYRNGLGATFMGEVFVWHLQTQSLEVAEMCSEIDEPCVRLAAPLLMKEGPPPPI